MHAALLPTFSQWRHDPHACPPLPSGFTTNPVILENDGVKCNIKSLTQLATAVGASPSYSPCLRVGAGLPEWVLHMRLSFPRTLASCDEVFAVVKPSCLCTQAFDLGVQELHLQSWGDTVQYP